MSVDPSWNCGTDPYPGTSALESTSSPAHESTSSTAHESTFSLEHKSTCFGRPPGMITSSHLPDELFLEELNPSCSCGAGILLGTINSTPMYDNHTCIGCILKPEKPKIPYLKQEYFDILQEMELCTNDPSLNYVTKITKLLQIWKNCRSTLLSHCNPCFGIHTFMHFAVSESAVLILQPQWEKIEEKIKNQFIGFTELIIPVLKSIECIPEVLETCQCFLNLLRSPWNYAPMPYCEDTLSETTKKNFLNLITHEKSIIIVHRLKVLLNDTEQTVSAMRFACAAVMVYEEIVIKDSNQTFYREEDYEYIRDTLYIIYELNNKRKLLISIFKEKDPRDEGKKLIRSFYKKIKYISTLQKNDISNNQKTVVSICELGSDIIVMNSVQKHYDLPYKDYSEIMRYWINMLFLLSESELFTDMNKPFYQQNVVNVLMLCYTADHVYTLIDIFYDKFGSKIPKTFYLSTFIRGLAMNADERLYCRCYEREDILWLSTLSLKQGYLKLSKLLEDLPYTYRECVLTAHCILPEKSLMVEIEKIAIKSGKLVPKDLTNVCGTSTSKIKGKSRKPNKSQKKNSNFLCKTGDTLMSYQNSEDSNSNIAHELKNLQPEPLTKCMIEYIMDVLSSPRKGSLNWNMQWPQIENVCQRIVYQYDIVCCKNVLKFKNLPLVHLDVPQNNIYILEKSPKLELDKDSLSDGIFNEDEESNISNSSGDRVYYKLDNSKSRQRKSKVRPKRNVKKMKITKPKTLRKRTKKSNSKTRLTGKRSDVKNKDNGKNGKNDIENINGEVDTTLETNNNVKVSIDSTLEETDNTIPDSNLGEKVDGWIVKEVEFTINRSTHLISIDSQINKNVESHKIVLENNESSVDTLLETNDNGIAGKAIVQNDKASIASILEETKNTNPDTNLEENVDRLILAEINITIDGNYSLLKHSINVDSPGKDNVKSCKNVLESDESTEGSLLEKTDNIIADTNIKTNSVSFISEENDNVTTDNDLKMNTNPQQIIKAHPCEDFDYNFLYKPSVNINSPVNDNAKSNENVLESDESTEGSILEKNDEENDDRWIVKEDEFTINRSTHLISIDSQINKNVESHKIVLENNESSVDTLLETNDNGIAGEAIVQNDKASIASILEETKNTNPDTNLEENVDRLILAEINITIDGNYSLSKHSINVDSPGKDNVKSCKNVLESDESTEGSLLEKTDNIIADTNIKTNSVSFISEENDNVTTDNDLKKNTNPQQIIKAHPCEDFDYNFLYKPSVNINSPVNDNAKSNENVLESDESTEGSILEKNDKENDDRWIVKEDEFTINRSTHLISIDSQINKNVESHKIVLENNESSVDTLLETNDNGIAGEAIVQNDKASIASILEETKNTNPDTNLEENVDRLILAEINITIDGNYSLSKHSINVDSPGKDNVKSCKNVLESDESTEGSLLEKTDNIIADTNIKTNSVSFISEENDNVTTDNDLKMNTNPQQIIKAHPCEDFDYNFLYKPSVNINSPVNDNAKSNENVLESDESTEGSILEKNDEENDDRWIVKEDEFTINRSTHLISIDSQINKNVESHKIVLENNESSVDTLLETNEDNIAVKFLKKNVNDFVHTILEETDSPYSNLDENSVGLNLEENNITINGNFQNDTEPEQINIVNQLEDLDYFSSKHSINVDSPVNDNVKSCKNVLESDESTEGYLLEETDNTSPYTNLDENSVGLNLEENIITINGNFQNDTEPQHNSKVRNCEDHDNFLSKQSEVTTSQVIENKNSLLNNLENYESSVVTCSSTNDDGIAGEAIVQNIKDTAGFILKETDNIIADTNIKTNSVSFISEENDNVTTDNDLKMNTNPQQIIKAHQCEDFDYNFLYKPTVNINSPVNDNAKSNENVLESDESTEGSILEKNDEENDDRWIVKEDEFTINRSTHLISIDSQINKNVESHKIVLENNESSVDTLLETNEDNIAVKFLKKNVNDFVHTILEETDSPYSNLDENSVGLNLEENNITINGNFQNDTEPEQINIVNQLEDLDYFSSKHSINVDSPVNDNVKSCKNVLESDESTEGYLLEETDNTSPYTNLDENSVGLNLEENIITINGNFQNDTEPQHNSKVRNCEDHDNFLSKQSEVTTSQVIENKNSLLNNLENYESSVVTCSSTNDDGIAGEAIVQNIKDTAGFILKETDNIIADTNIKTNSVSFISEENDNVTTDNDLKMNTNPQQIIKAHQCEDFDYNFLYKPTVNINSPVNDNAKSNENVLESDESTEGSILEKNEDDIAVKFLKQNVNDFVHTILEETDSPYTNLDENSVGLNLEENNITINGNFQNDIEPQQNIKVHNCEDHDKFLSKQSEVTTSQVIENKNSLLNNLENYESSVDRTNDDGIAGEAIVQNIKDTAGFTLKETDNIKNSVNATSGKIDMPIPASNYKRKAVTLSLESNDNITTDNKLKKNTEIQQNIKRVKRIIQPKKDPAFQYYPQCKPSVNINSPVNDNVKTKCRKNVSLNNDTISKKTENGIADKPITRNIKNSVNATSGEIDRPIPNSNFKRKAVTLCLESNDNITTDNKLKKNTEIQQNIKRGKRIIQPKKDPAFQYYPQCKPSVNINSPVNDNVKTKCRKNVSLNNDTISKKNENGKADKPITRNIKNSINATSGEIDRPIPNSNFKRKAVTLCLESNDNITTDNKLKKNTEIQQNIKRGKRIIQPKKDPAFQYYPQCKPSVNINSPVNDNVKTKCRKNVSLNNDTISKKTENGKADKPITRNIKNSVNATSGEIDRPIPNSNFKRKAVTLCLESNDNITTDNKLKKNTEIQQNIKRGKRIIQPKKDPAFQYYPQCKPSVNINSPVNDNVKTKCRKNVSLNNDTISKKNENGKADKPITRNIKNSINATSGEIDRPIPNSNFKRKAVTLCLESNDNITTDNKSKKNTEIQQNIKRGKRIIQPKKDPAFQYYPQCKPSVNINSPVNDNVKTKCRKNVSLNNDTISKKNENGKADKPITRNIKNSINATSGEIDRPIPNSNFKRKAVTLCLESNDNITTDNKLKKNTEIIQNIKRGKRIIQPKKDPAFQYYAQRKPSVNINSPVNDNVKTKCRKNVSLNNDTISKKTENGKADKPITRNIKNSTDNKFKKNTEPPKIIKRRKRIIKAKELKPITRHGINTRSKGIVSKRDYSSSILSKNSTKSSLNSISMKNRNVKTSNNYKPHQIAKKGRSAFSTLRKRDIANRDLKGNTKLVGSIFKKSENIKTSKNKLKNVLFQHKVIRPKRLIKKKQYDGYDYSLVKRSASLILEKNDNIKAGGNLKGRARLSVDSHNIVKEKVNVNINTKNDESIPQRAKRVVTKIQHREYDYSLTARKIRKSNKTNCSLNSGISKDSEVCSTSINTPSTSTSNHLFMNDESHDPYYNEDHLNNLRQQMTQLSSMEYMIPTNTDRIVNVVQIQTTSNPLTNVSQTQTEHISNHSNNEIEKKTNNNQTNTHSLDNFVSLYQSNSLNNNMNSIQDSGIQGECSFTGRVSVSNQRIASDSNSNLHNTSQCETTKLIGSQDVLIDQNSINLNHDCWNDINVQNSGNHLQSIIENDVHLSSNVIVRTSDVINSSVVSHTGQLRNVTQKSYCIKNRDRFIDLTLPDSISSISTNSNNCSTNIMNSNKSNFDSKIHQSSPVQTSVGLQVNFNNPQSECIQNAMSPNNQSTQICNNVSENSTLTNISASNDQNIINSINSVVSTSSIVNTLFTKENHILESLKSSMPVVNPVSSIQTQTCMDGLHISNEVSNSNASVISLTIASTQSQVIKTNVHNSLYTTSQNQRVPHSDLSHITLQINTSDEQKQIDHLKLVSQTFITTSEAIKFVTSSTESHNFFQSNEKTRTSNLASFPNTTEGGLSNINQENNLNSKLTNRGRGSMRTYESKTRALKQANMSDMFVLEKGTLYAAQDNVINQIEHIKPGISSKNHTMTTQAKIKNTITTKESLEKPKLSTNASPNITITGSMLPRFQQVFGKTKFQTSTIINDTSSLCSTSVISNPSSTGPIVNQTNLSMSRVYSSSIGVQTNHEIDQIISNSINCITPKIVDNKLQQNITMTKSTNAVIDNNKNNVIMTCKTGSSVKNISQVSLLSSHQTLTSNIDTNNIIKKELCGTPTSKVPTFTASCNNLVASSSSNIINSIPIQSESNDNVDKITHTTTQRHLKVPPPIVQTILRRHPNWQQNKFRQGKQSTEVMASSTFERLISSNMLNVTKTTIECSNNKVLVSTIKPNVTESNASSSMMEQVREFESVLEEVRKTSLMNEMSTASILPQINHEIIQIHSPIENVDLLNANSNQTLFPLNEKPNISNEREHCSFSFLNQALSNVNDISEQKEPVTVPPTTISVPSVTPVPAETSPTSSISVNPTDGSPQCPNNQIENKQKPIIKTPASSPSISTVKVPVLQQKPLPKLQEDEQTTQRIYAILDKYAEQLRNSPELKNKPAPRRRTNPPTNPSINTKRKKSNQFNLKSCSQQTSCSSSGMEMSPTSDVQALDSEDSSNAVSHFSHIINSPSGNSDEQNTATVILENPSIENTLLTVHDVINKINVEAEIKSQVSQSTQIVMNGTSGSFLSMPESSAANVRLVVAAGKNQKMYRLHCPVTGPGPVLFQQISTNDSCSNDVKISSNILGQSISESTILSALTSCDLQVTNTDLVKEISSNTSKTPKIIDHKTNKPDIILESMEKAQVLDNNEKQLPFYPVMKKSQGSQSTFSVIHPLPKCEPDDTIESLAKDQNNIKEDIQNNLHDNIQDGLNVKEEAIPYLKNDQVVFVQEKLSKTLKNETPIFIPPGSSESTGITFVDLKFPTFQEDKQNNATNTTDAVKKINQQKISEVKIENSNTDISIDYFGDNRVVSNEPNNSCSVICEDGLVIKQEKSFSSITEGSLNTLDFPNTKTEESETKSTHTSNIHKAEKSSGIMKIECESNNENDNTFSTSTYKLLDDQFSDIKNTKFLVQSLKSDKTSKNWTVCLSQIMPSGTEKMLEGENLVRLQELFEQSEIKTFKDFKNFLFEQCKQFDGNVERLKEYNLYDIMNGLSVDKHIPNELFSNITVIHNLDKSENTNLDLAHTSTSKLMDINNLQARRKSVLSHTTASTVITTGAEHAASVACKKNKTKVSFLKQALYNEMHQDANDCESKHFLNGSTKMVFESMEQIDSGPESPLNTTAVDSETCMSEDSTSTISSGTPHYNFRKSKRKNKNFEEDGFIESQVIKRMYRGRAAEDNEEKTELHKISNVKVQTSEQKQTVEKKETNNRRISSRLKNNSAKNNQQLSNKSPQMDSPPRRITSTRASLRRVSRKTT